MMIGKMNGSMSKLNTLTENKTLVFYSPIEGKDVLVRTGVINDNRCFVHSLLHAYSKDYVKMDNKERLKFVEKLYNNLSRKIQEKKWKEVSSDIVAKLPFQDKVSRYFNDFYKYIMTDEPTKGKTIDYVIKDIITLDDDKEIFKVMFELISVDKFNKVLTDTYNKNTDICVDDTKDKIIYAFEHYVKGVLEELGNSLDDERRNYCLDKIVLMMISITDIASNSACRDFLEDNDDKSDLIVDSHILSVFSEKINRDIYFINGKNRLPYQLGDDTDNIKGRKSIILIWLGGSRYEVVGRLLPHNKIQREFETDDPLIRRINMFVYRPELIPEHYPNLTPYIEHSNKKNTSEDSKSGSHSKSQSKSSSSSASSSSSSSSSSASSSSSSSSSSSRTPQVKKKHNKKSSSRGSPTPIRNSKNIAL
jgi:hypothetical protein